MSQPSLYLNGYVATGWTGVSNRNEIFFAGVISDFLFN